MIIKAIKQLFTIVLMEYFGIYNGSVFLMHSCEYSIICCTEFISIVILMEKKSKSFF